TERWNRALAAGRETVFVAERGGEIVGFSSGGPPQQPELGYASELYALYLMRSSQGSGIGRQLFERFADSMRQRGHENLYCWVVRGNPTAAFYRHVGGEQREEKAIEIGGRLITEDLFLWQLAFVRATK
ncbi:GNAT family N-acetyltransferase, partial [Staphylococcus epidermidis]|uniref:GNAT family N-acetyltransferase n=1 Tax=Staphylococcus epidermidis TaxID=1282 RepID=UPI00273A55EE